MVLASLSSDQVEGGRKKRYAGILCCEAAVSLQNASAHLHTWLFSVQAYQEAVIVNMLEVFLYHDYAAEALGDSIVDLVDFCMRKVSFMIRL